MNDELQRLLVQGRAEGVYTHASLCVVRGGEVLAEADVPDAGHVFDIASVTKVLTAIAVLQQLPVDRRVAWLDGAPTVGQLLSHSSGLPAWRPLFAHAAKRLDVPVGELVVRAGLQAQAQGIYREVIGATKADAARPTYSDLGFMALGFELGDRLERVLLGLLRPGIAGEPAGRGRVATGRGRPRGGNPDVDPVGGEVKVDPNATDAGPDDDNAACVGGCAGHAGLFATAAEVSRLGDRLRRDAQDGSGGLLPRDKAELMFTRVAGTRTCGLDTPSGDLPAIGSILGRGAKGAAGHLGFTGCSLWIDRDAKLSIAFLTNAVLLARPSPALKAFRPLVHDAVARFLGL